MRFRILGPLEAEANGAAITLGGPFERRLLGVLLLEAGRVVPLSSLVDALWEHDPPATAAKQVRNGVSKLRRLLAEAGAPGPVVTQSTGYRICLQAGALDTQQFETATARAAVSSADPEEAARLLRCALDLWRGPLLGGMTGHVFSAASARWQERRQAAAETYYDHQLTLGRHAQIAGELAALVAEYPVRERAVGQLMLALYRCGRQADALGCYRRTRLLLSGELGLDPSRDLQRLHQMILANHPDLSVLCPAPQAKNQRLAVTQVAVPRQLPAVVTQLAGRDAELSRLTCLLDGNTTIAVISGSAGTGKTALAVRFAQLAAPRFPDGQLYVNLRGFDPVGLPVSPAEVVRGFLDAFGVPPDRVPASLDAQAGLYRSLVAERRVLVVLDNARDAAQARPLLPGGAGCMVLVTSRDRLASLVASEAASPLTLGVLAARGARELLAARIGTQRVASEPQAAAEIAELCSRLPLALSIVAARAAGHPQFPLAALAGELRATPGGPLEVCDAQGADTSLRAVFSWSLRQLSPPATRLFRLLGLHPGPDVSGPAAASLAAIAPPAARSLLAELARASLISEHLPGRFSCHDLLRAYAAEQATACEPAEQRHAAVTRLLGHYVHTANAANTKLNPLQERKAVPLTAAAPHVTTEPIADAEAARAWFSAEHRVLLAAIASAGDVPGGHAWRLAGLIHHYLSRCGHWHEMLTCNTTALGQARHDSDRLGQAHAHGAIGAACSQLGRRDEAVGHLSKSLALFTALGDQAGQADLHTHLACVVKPGQTALALWHSRQALTRYEATGNMLGCASALNNIGWSQTRAGDHDEALSSCQQALAWQRRAGDTLGQAYTLDSIGYAHHGLGQYKQARECYEEALALDQALGNRPHEADVLSHLGDACRDDDAAQEARTAWQQALDVYQQIGHPGAATVRAKLAGLAPYA